MSAKITKTLKYIILLAVAGILLYFAFRGQDLNELWAGIKKANFGWILAGLGVSFLSHWSRGVRWVMLIKPLGYTTTNLRATASVFLGYLANMVFPRMGEVTRCASLRKTDKIPVESLLGTVVVERVLDLLCLGGVLLLSIIFQASTIFDFLDQYLFHPVADKVEGNSLLLTVIVVLFLGLLITLYFIYQKYREMILANRVAGKLANLFRGIKNGLFSIAKLKNPFLFIGHTIFIWSAYFLSTYFFMMSVEATSHLGLTVALFALVLSSLGMAAPVQGGIGALHYMVSQGLLLFGISLQEGLLFATILHGSQTLLVIVVGAISLIYLLSLSSKNTHIEDIMAPDNIIAEDEQL